jgi:hypothetical protein
VSDEYRSLTRNILRHYRAATPEHIKAGLGWYDAAREECEAIALLGDATIEQAVVALSHLSPRVSWQQNVKALRALLAGQPPPPGTFTRSWAAALEASVSDDPMGTFGRDALKTRYFAAAILGDQMAVVVDVWAGRVAGVMEHTVRRSSGYNAIADAYRRAAKIEQVAPRDMQAITWCHIRGRAT